MDIMTPTSVYRYYDVRNILLYVGITSRRTTRQREHNSDKEWWPFVARQDVEHFDSRPLAAAREVELIRRYRPPFNVQHNPDNESMREIYLAGSTLPIIDFNDPKAPMQMVGSLGHRIPLSRASGPGTSVVYVCHPEHNVVARALLWQGRVMLRAPKRVADLSSFQPGPSTTTFEFQSAKRIPAIDNLVLHIKFREGKPRRLRMHEATPAEVTV